MLEFKSPTDEPIYVNPRSVIAIEAAHGFEGTITPDTCSNLLLTNGETLTVRMLAADAHAAIDAALPDHP